MLDWSETATGATVNVPPKVKLPEDVTVPLKVNPETVPVPLTLVTVPDPEYPEKPEYPEIPLPE